MSITDLRKELEEIRTHAQEGDLAQVVQKVDRALHALDSGQMVTTTQAAHLLGIRSVNTLKLLVRRSGLPYEMHGNRMMVSVAVLERLQESPEVGAIRASDRAHDASEALGSMRRLTAAQLDDLEAGRPGQLPWDAQPRGDTVASEGAE